MQSTALKTFTEKIKHKNGHIRIATIKRDNQQGPPVEHMELCSVLCGELEGRGDWGRMDTCICMAELLCYSAETITKLLIRYTPIKNKTVKQYLSNGR